MLFFKSQKIFVLILTILIFSLSYFYEITQIIIHCMSFLILMEVVRTIYEYLTNNQHRIKVRYVIDGAILFGIRELFVGWVMLKENQEKGMLIMSLSFIGIFILIMYRILVIKSSPDYTEKCEVCTKKGNDEK